MFSFANITCALVFLYLLHNCESVLRDIYWNTTDYRISKPGMRPTYYRLKFTPNIEKRTFILQSVVSINITRWTALYKFYVKNLLLQKCVFEVYQPDTHGQIEIPTYISPRKRRSAAEPGDIIHISTDVLHDPKYETEFVLHCKHIVGSLTNQLRGFYYDEYYEKGLTMNFLSTQFGPIGSRYAFPSFDEPCFRARFRIVIYRPIEYTCVLSNSKIISSIISGELIEDEFELTEDISPSSLAFIVSKLKVTDILPKNIHQFVLREELLISNQHEFAANLINRAYQEIQNFLAVNCELRHFYHVALPSNRMQFESLGSYRGMNHYKENVLICLKNMTSVKEESSTIAIVKLLAQQWFKNYISLDSWTWAWLSEGFTMYLSYNITNKIYPHRLTNERLVCEIRSSMQIDSGIYSIALNDEAMKPSEIESKFNDVTVYKGTALIITMERILHPYVFKGALKDLFENSKWATYTSKSFYEIIETRISSFQQQNLILPISFTAIMLTWEAQVGYPVLTVTRNYNSDITIVSISQTRFWFHKSNTKWAIPITYSSPLCAYWNNTRPMHWLVSRSGHITIKQLRKKDWLIINNQATYYYRVNYDERNWLSIIEALQVDHESIHYLNRMQLIDDAFNLAEYGMLRYEIAFKLSSYIIQEREYAPLWAMKQAYFSVNKKLLYSEEYENFQVTIKHAVEFIYNQIYCVQCTTPDNLNAHRHNLIVHMIFDWLCELKSQKCCCEKNGMMQLKRSSSIPFEIQNDFEKQKLCIGIRKGNKTQWHQLFDHYKLLKNASESNNYMFNALLCTEDGKLQRRFLNFIMKSDKYKLLDALKLTITNHENGLDAALKFVLRHLNYLLKEFVNKDIKDILNDIGSRITTQEQLKTLSKFTKKHTKYNDLMKMPISKARENLVWREKYLSKVDFYVKEIKSSAAMYYKNVHIVILVLPYFTNLYLLDFGRI